MQFWLIFALCLGCAVGRDLYVGGGASSSKKSVNDLHYEQHSQSVEEARKKINDQLGTSNSVYTPCGSCGGQISNAHDYQTRDFGLGVGVGLVGLSSGLSGSTGSSSNSLSSSHYTQQSQPIIIPVGGGSESYRHQSEQRSQSQSTPILISPTGGSESYQRHYEKRIESQASPIIVSPSTGADSYQRHYEKRVESQSAPIIMSPSGGSESYQRHYEKRVQSQAAPIVMPSNGGSESYQRHYEKRVQSQSAPLIIPPSGGSESYQHHFEKRVESQASPIIVAPTGASESYHQQSQRITQSQAAPIYVHPTGGSESYRQESQRITQSQAAPIYVHPTGGSESYRREEELQKIESHPTPVLYSPGGSSSHSLYSHKQVSQSVPTIQYVPPSSVGSEYSEFSQKMIQNQARPVTIYPASSSQISHDSLRQSSSSQVAGSGYPYYPVTSGNSGRSSELGSSQWGLGASLDLNNYMSESERLARLQAQNVNPGGLRAGSSVYNSGNDLGVSVSASDSSRPAYRSQSWEKSSKWASGMEYGSDGKPKNYNLLSTAESEQHNINGNQAGYKAATTTLDDNGKVSTYSIHTR